MKWIRTRVTYEAQDPETAAAMIADIFYDLGLEGVIMEGPDSEADPHLDWAQDAPPGPDQHAVIGFFRYDKRLGQNRQELEQKLAALYAGNGAWYRVSYSDVDEQDWAESWKAHFHPVKISEKIVVKPTWRQYTPQNREMVIELDPGMAFGTGTHPTTALCLRLVERYVRPGIGFLDIGTGSGILLIAAAKLGAARLLGTDCDPVAVSIAEQNLRLNQIRPERFSLASGNLVEPVSEKFDLAAANILTNTIVPMIPEIPRLLEKEGIFIASGITAENTETVTDALAEHGFDILEVLIADEWAAIAAKAPKTP
mgnify:CR=1 FL=1